MITGGGVCNCCVVPPGEEGRGDVHQLHCHPDKDE